MFALPPRRSARPKSAANYQLQPSIQRIPFLARKKPTAGRKKPTGIIRKKPTGRRTTQPRRKIIRAVTRPTIQRVMKRRKLNYCARRTHWLRCNGWTLLAPCPTKFCYNVMNFFKADWHCAHKTARSKGGTYAPSNIVTMCATCNGKMSTTLYNRFRADVVHNGSWFNKKDFRALTKRHYKELLRLGGQPF